jgi:integrase
LLESAVTEDIQTLVAVLPQDKLIGKRDRAMILLGFAGAFRRAELVSLNVADIQQTQKGLLITLRKSKTDQEGRGKKKAIPNGQREETCPVRAYQAWIKASGITKGPVFRGVDRHGNLLPKRCCGEAVAIVLKRAAEKAGLDPTVFAGHSLRAGLVTQAIIAGVPIHKIMEQTDHKSERMLREYIRDAEVWRDNAAAATGI